MKRIVHKYVPRSFYRGYVCGTTPFAKGTGLWRNVTCKTCLRVHRTSTGTKA